MGLFTGLLTLPLAPVRGVAWIAQYVADEADRQANDDSSLRRELLQLELDRDAGLLDDHEYAERADALLEQIAERHTTSTPGAEPAVSTEWHDG